MRWWSMWPAGCRVMPSHAESRAFGLEGSQVAAKFGKEEGHLGRLEIVWRIMMYVDDMLMICWWYVDDMLMIYVDDICWWYMLMIYVDDICWWYMLMIYVDDICWWYMLMIYVDDICWWYMLMIYVDDICWWYMLMIYVDDICWWYMLMICWWDVDDMLMICWWYVDMLFFMVFQEHGGALVLLTLGQINDFWTILMNETCLSFLEDWIHQTPLDLFCGWSRRQID